MKKQLAATLVLAGLVMGGLLSCESFKEGYKASFIKSWRESFVKSCAEKDNSAEKQKFCECVADKSIAEMTLEQLHDVSYSIKYIQEHIVPECQQSQGQ